MEGRERGGGCSVKWWGGRGRQEKEEGGWEGEWQGRKRIKKKKKGRKVRRQRAQEKEKEGSVNVGENKKKNEV